MVKHGNSVKYKQNHEKMFINFITVDLAVGYFADTIFIRN